MEQVIFKLKEPQKGIPKSKQKPTPVNMFFSFGYYEISSEGKKQYIPLKYTTGMSITPCYWNDKPHYRAKQTKEFSHENFNNKLENLKNTVIDLKRELETKGKLPTPAMLRVELNKRLGKGAAVNRMSPISFMELFIRESEEGKRIGNTGRRISNSTVRDYKGTKSVFKKFLDHKGTSYSFDQLSTSFYKEFVSFMQKKDYGNNTIGKHIKNLKVFLKEAYRRGLTSNESFKDEDFRVFQEDTQQVYLNEIELKKIYSHDFSDNSRLDKVRDLFLFACYTGLRFSDLSKISEENFVDGRSRIKVITTKTSELVDIPVHWMVRKIFGKYDGKIPATISNQKLNKYIKEVCEEAKINEKVIHVKTKGGMRYEDKVEKHKLVTTHTARRSFATNMFLAGVSPLQIMKITGHRTEKAFLRYIRISQEDNAKKLAGHEFFRGII